MDLLVWAMLVVGGACFIVALVYAVIWAVEALARGYDLPALSPYTGLGPRVDPAPLVVHQRFSSHSFPVLMRINEEIRAEL